MVVRCAQLKQLVHVDVAPHVLIVIVRHRLRRRLSGRDAVITGALRNDSDAGHQLARRNKLIPLRQHQTRL